MFTTPWKSPLEKTLWDQGYRPRTEGGSTIWVKPDGTVATFGEATAGQVVTQKMAMVGAVMPPSIPFFETEASDTVLDTAAGIAGAAAQGMGPAMTLLGMGGAVRLMETAGALEAKAEARRQQDAVQSVIANYVDFKTETAEKLMDDFGTDAGFGSDVGGFGGGIGTALGNVDWSKLVSGGAAALFNRIAMGGGAGPVVRDYGPAVALPGGAMVTPAGFGTAMQKAGQFLGNLIQGPGGQVMALGAGGALVRTAGAVVRSASGAIRGVIGAGGKLIRSGQAAALAKKVGIEAASAALGIGALELAQMVLADSTQKSRKRNRGISGSDLKRARRTIGKVERAHRYIVRACTSAHVGTHRKSAPARRCR